MGKEKGITLIALVITIIVLLILAGVTIVTLTGDNGLLQKAQTAKEENEKAKELELIKLAVSAAQTAGEGTITTENLNKELRDNFGNEKDAIKFSNYWIYSNYMIYENGEIEKYSINHEIEATTRITKQTRVLNCASDNWGKEQDSIINIYTNYDIARIEAVYNVKDLSLKGKKECECTRGKGTYGTLKIVYADGSYENFGLDWSLGNGRIRNVVSYVGTWGGVQDLVYTYVQSY